MSNNALLEAIKTCSERPSKCFYFKETLSELGYHNIYSYEDRYSSLMDVTKKGYAVLVPEGLGVGGGGGGVSVKAEEGFIQKRGREVLGLVEAGGGFVQNSLAIVQSSLEGVAHGAIQLTKDGDIRDAFETMNAVKEHRYEEYSHKLSDNAQSVVDNDPLIQTASSVINSTVGVALNTVDEVAKENLSEDAYFYVSSTADPVLTLLPGAIGPVKNAKTGIKYQQSLALSEKVIAYQKRVDAVRDKLPSKLRREGNVAVADVEIAGLKKEFIAHSQVHSPASKGADLADFTHAKEKKKRTFENYIEDKGYIRFNDTEAKILEDIASKIKPDTEGAINLYTEKIPCKSCSSIIEEFRDKFQRIELNIYHGEMI